MTTTWSYDSPGRKISEVRPDGTQTTWAYILCSNYSGTCPASAVYLVQSPLGERTGESHAGEPAVIRVEDVRLA
ncbi:MAG TPA: hypothetical protein VH684_19115 [Xanthobacteraceae bacterium]